MKYGVRAFFQKAVALLCALLLPWSVGFGQAPPGPPANSQNAPNWQTAQQGPPLLSPQQLDNLVAPVALYPDPLLGQVLAASTYPVEIIEVQQWLQRNPNLQDQQLLEAAKQQNWDPSVQALVAFPDALNLLGNDIQWTTGLGNAFLAQQGDVMNAVQRMRARAQAAGRLQSTPQQVVTTEMQDGQSAIEIQPASPQMIYVPVYQPEYVWGPPAWGAYPDLWYPSGFEAGFGFGFGTGVFVSGLFSGLVGWGGWGWGLGWFGRGLGLFINPGFFSRFGFHNGFGGFGGGGVGGRMAWAHDPGHRMGVSYPNRSVANRFGSNNFAGGGRRSGFGGSNSGRFNFARSSGNFARQGFANNAARPASQGYRASAQSFRGNNYATPSRSGASYNRSIMPAYSARGQNFSAARSYSAPRQNFSAPHVSSGGSSHFSGGHSFGGGGGHSFSGGHSSVGRSGGGGHSSGGHSSGGHHR